MYSVRTISYCWMYWWRLCLNSMVFLLRWFYWYTIFQFHYPYSCQFIYILELFECYGKTLAGIRVSKCRSSVTITVSIELGYWDTQYVFKMCIDFTKMKNVSINIVVGASHIPIRRYNYRYWYWHKLLTISSNWLEQANSIDIPIISYYLLYESS